MLFDTDMFIWVQRGNLNAKSIIDAATQRYLSLQTYMELLQGAKNKDQLRLTRNFLKSLEFEVLPLTENIGHRAAIYIEEYTLSHGIRAGDALIAATAVEHQLPLISSNAKHYRAISDLIFVEFSP